MAPAEPKPFFSVVIPSYNSARWIDEALASAAGQGASEIIVVDDGSTDDSAARAEAAGARVITQQNQGPAAARNRGIAEARGDWIAFLDADDRWRPGHLDRLAEAIRLFPQAALVFSAAMVVDAEGRELKPKDSPPLGPDPFLSLLLRNTITTSCAAARRDAIIGAGGFCAAFKWGEDWDLWLRLARLHPVVRVPLITVNYRRQEAGLVHTTIDRIRDQNLAVVLRGGSLEPRISDDDLRRARANCYFESAVRHLAAEDPTGARAELVAGIRQRPASPKMWALAALTLGGRPAARALKSWWRRREEPAAPAVRATSVATDVRVDFMITDSGTGGAEKMLAALAQGLDRGIRPRLIVLKPPGRRAEELRAAGVSVEWLGLPASLGSGYAFRLPRAAARLWRLLRQDPPDILHCWLFQANLLGRVVGRLARVPAIISGLRVMEEEKKIQFPLDRLTRRLVDRYLAVSTGTAIFYADRLGLGAGQVEVIPNGIEIPIPAPDRADARTALGLAEADRVALFLGRLHAQKGLDVLLNAIPAAAAAVPGLRVLIAGEGPEHGRLEAQARALAITDRIRFLGERTDTAPLLAASDCLVLPSRWEGMPNAVLEAMAAGLAVVATAVGAAPEMVISGGPDRPAPGETGMVVPPGDATALAAALAAVLSDPARARAMGEAGLCRVRAVYRLADTIAAHQEFYWRLAAAPPRRMVRPRSF